MCSVYITELFVKMKYSFSKKGITCHQELRGNDLLGVNIIHI